MSRFVITYRCWNCSKEYSSIEVFKLAKGDKEEVICPSCNGYIITPLGQALTKGKMVD